MSISEMNTRLVDPVHFFDAQGNSMVSNEHQRARILELEAENAKLRRLLMAQIRKQQEEDLQKPPSQ